MSHVTIEIPAQSRADVGKGASRRLRRKQNLVPAIVYGAGKPATNLTIPHNVMLKATQHEVFFSSILMLSIDGKKEKVVLKDMQRHPAKELIMHADFMRIDESAEMHMYIPIHFVGEEKSPGIKAGGVVNHALNEIEIKCLPANLPESINIDVSTLDIGSALHIRDIVLPQGVKFTHPVEDDAHNHLIYSIHEPRVEEEEIDTAAPVAPETEVIREKPAESAE